MLLELENDFHRKICMPMYAQHSSTYSLPSMVRPRVPFSPHLAGGHDGLISQAVAMERHWLGPHTTSGAQNRCIWAQGTGQG
jgi:hypothetical protein